MKATDSKHPSKVPFVEDRVHTGSNEDGAIVEQIRQRRLAGGHSGLLQLDRMLLHAPPLAAGWNSFMGAVRTQTTLADDVRELIICRVAVLNNAEYEWGQHAPLLRAVIQQHMELRIDVEYDAQQSDPGAQEHAMKRARGLLKVGSTLCEQGELYDLVYNELDKLPAADIFMAAVQVKTLTPWDKDCFQPLRMNWTRQYLPLLRYIDAMTKHVHVKEEVFAGLRESLPPHESGNRTMVEITTTCAAYNCVSRFLVALDVGRDGYDAL